MFTIISSWTSVVVHSSLVVQLPRGYIRTLNCRNPRNWSDHPWRPPVRQYCAPSSSIWLHGRPCIEPRFSGQRCLLRYFLTRSQLSKLRQRNFLTDCVESSVYGQQTVRRENELRQLPDYSLTDRIAVELVCIFACTCLSVVGRVCCSVHKTGRDTNVINEILIVPRYCLHCLR